MNVDQAILPGGRYPRVEPRRSHTESALFAEGETTDSAFNILPAFVAFVSGTWSSYQVQTLIAATAPAQCNRQALDMSLCFYM